MKPVESYEVKYSLLGFLAKSGRDLERTNGF
jgi:hypothetical protein